jgi:hypothetical protein
MPRKIVPKPCACGCGDMTKGGKFIPGHDSRTLSAILHHINGDLTDLRRLVEDVTGERVVVDKD